MSGTDSQILHPSSLEAGSRLDAFLAEHIDTWSRSRLQRLIEDEDVLVNGRPVKSSYKVREGDEIEVELTEIPPAQFEPEDISLDIVYEDECLAVINKPAGMVVHPGAGVPNGTLANAIAWHFKSEPPASAGGQFVSSDTTKTEPNWPPADAGGSDRIGIVHRLDKDTSGLIVVAKDEQTAEELSREFHDREVEKSYVALVHGVIEENSGTIDRPIARDRHNRTKMTVAANGRNALTLWRVRQRFEKFTLLDIDIKTGRTHQIRVHLASINHPVVGDATYNAGRDAHIADNNLKKAVEHLGRFFLHAQRLAFTHPKTGERMEFTQELPEALKELLGLLG
ncbi:MAG: RluA family pseudouridine synthase [Chloracidobacterium sp.]|nr:RluA family pseudouridine synthase [Chloracidobacterium sp.]